jgi:hypothetical protein
MRPGFVTDVHWTAGPPGTFVAQSERRRYEAGAGPSIP